MQTVPWIIEKRLTTIRKIPTQRCKCKAIYFTAITELTLNRQVKAMK